MQQQGRINMSNKIEKDNVLIDVHDLHKAFGEHQVLKGIDIQICKGEVIAIIGPSGCGKSTIIISQPPSISFPCSANSKASPVSIPYKISHTLFEPHLGHFTFIAIAPS